MTFSAGRTRARQDRRSAALAAVIMVAALTACAGPTAESVSAGGVRAQGNAQAHQAAPSPVEDVTMVPPAPGSPPAAAPPVALARAPVTPPGAATEWPPAAEPGANAIANSGPGGGGASAVRPPARPLTDNGFVAAGGPAVAGAGSPQTAAYTGPQACVLAVRGESPVARACREGGVRSAKTAMKNLVAQAKANGARFRCDDCHVNLDNYAQLGQGVEDKFNRLLAAAGVR